jgi:hypothetical protein
MDGLLGKKRKDEEWEGGWCERIGKYIKKIFKISCQGI